MDGCSGHPKGGSWGFKVLLGVRGLLGSWVFIFSFDGVLCLLYLVLYWLYLYVGDFGEYGSGGHVSLNYRFLNIRRNGILPPPHFHTC